MLYLSRGEQATLVVLAALLLGGAGVATYRRGVEAGGAREVAPIFVEAAPVRGEPPPSAITTQYTPPRPERALGKTSARPAPPRAETTGPISLNRATLEELDSLPGIGPVYAQRILDYRAQLRRETGRGFTSVDELLNVSGIGPKRLAALRERVIP